MKTKGFEPKRNERGDPQVVCTCADCGREEVVRAVLGVGNADRRALSSKSLGQATKKLTQNGWSYVKRTLRCPECEAKRREAMSKKSGSGAGGAAVDVTPLPERPTREQKRAIVNRLDKVYDLDKGRYMSGESDFVVAEDLRVRPGWVTEVRDELFGPEGTNDDVEEFGEMLDLLHKQINEKVQKGEEMVAELRSSRAEVAKMKVEFERLQKALGPHVLAKAGMR